MLKNEESVQPRYNTNICHISPFKYGNLKEVDKEREKTIK